MIDAKALFGGFRPAWTEVPQTVVSGAAPHPAGQYRYSARSFSRVAFTPVRIKAA